MYLKCQYKQSDLDFDVDFYPQLLTPDLAQAWYLYLDSILPHDATRSSVLFGDTGLIYRVTYRGNTSERKVHSWDTIHALPQLKSLVENITNQTYTVCVIQRYPSGKVGISPHKDKEMVLGTRISGLSLGATRTISFLKPSPIWTGKPTYDTTVEPINITLTSGSLYVMNPPTNQKWLHSIVQEPAIKESRISLTFRDYQG